MNPADHDRTRDRADAIRAVGDTRRVSDVVFGTTRRRARYTGLACAMVLGLTLSACGAMPRSGPVHKVIEPTEQTQQSAMPFNPQGPRVGATAQEIVEGFLAAGVGAQDDYSVARQYLTPQLAATWKPDTRVLIHLSLIHI